MKCIRTKVSRFNVREGNDEDAWRKLAHYFAGHVEGQLVARRRAAGMHKTCDGGFDAVFDAWIQAISRIEYVPAEPFVVAASHRGGQLGFDLFPICHVCGSPPAQGVDDSHQHQLLGKHHVCAICRAVVQRRTGTDQAGERLVARYNPRIAPISVLTLAELFKDGWSGGSKLAPIIY